MVFSPEETRLQAVSAASWTPDYTRINDAVGAAWELVSSGENLNVQEVLDNVNAECQGYLDEWWEVWG